MVDQVLAQDLQVDLGQDQETINLINNIKLVEETHLGQDQVTLDLVARLQDDANKEMEVS